jgi:formylglycine-generating enzyme required for sulfatase activity/tRNA A-37 threonylcarbamoyl transferase component Bud32/succinate dehydrogenase flavin-adding protein (antitoxin of CptAB toxin-antitoxin module)
MPSADDHTPVPPDGQPPGPPKPHRVAVPTDPTMPIRLRPPTALPTAKPLPPSGKPPTATPVPTARPLPTPAPASRPSATPLPAARPATRSIPKPEAAKPSLTMKADDGLWLGSEQTMVGQQPPSSPSDRLPVVLLEEEWLGNEKTTLPISRPGADTADDANWIGSEQTMVGTPVGTGAAPLTDSDLEYLGRDATIIGTPAPIAGASDRKGGTTTSGGNLSKKTAPTMDDGWHLKGRQGPLTGKTVGDYEVGGILGEGGMGTVYRARQVSLKRRVALKVLPPNLANDVRLRERFEQEARTASLLNSPNVVQVFAAGAFEDMVYFVMEFVEGTDLSEQLRTKQDTGELFTPDEAANFVIQAARGLAEAAKHNIVHRDIKPANLMITAKGVVKVADFGISKIAGEHGLTMTGTAVGTPAYCSPEQGRGDQVDARADIYSLGVVFYELLTGKKPFEGATANALIYQHNYAEPKLPTDLRAEIPNAYQAVVLKCLQKDPAKRYQDAAELVADLERVRAGSAPMTALMSAFGTGADEAMRRLGIKQRRLWPYLVAALLLVSVIAGGVVTYQKRLANQQNAVKEIVSLRDALRVLDKTLPVPKGAESDLAKLSALVAKDDKDVVRWRTKLDRVVALRNSLLRLDQDGLPEFALRTDTTADLAKYREDVGSEGEDVKRWQEKLDAALREIASEREALGELDKAPVVTVAMAERLDPLLQKFAKLVDAAKDDDVARWQGKLELGKSRTGQLRASLAALDDPKTVLSEAALARLDGDLASLKAIVGDQDPGVRGWAARITAGHENISRLRLNLRRLDGVEWATTSLQAALSADLKTFAALVDANDPDLKKWNRKIEDSLARLKSLRLSLARLDQPANLTVDEQKVAGDQLSAFRALVSPDDGQLQAWSARMRAEATNLGTLEEELKRLDRPERLTVSELDVTTKALNALVKLGGIPENQRVVAEHRLQEERRKLDELRQYLHSHQLGDLVDQELADNLTLLARLAGEQDEDVKHWRIRVDEYLRLRTALQPLDAAASPPEHADQLLKDYAVIVGKQSVEVRRWGTKLERIAALRQALSVLDHQAPLPENAPASVSALLVEVGDKDPEAKRWAAKVARVGTLFSALDGELQGAYVLPPSAPKQSNELVALVGLGDERAAAIATRVAVLAGPGKPGWAADYSRDEYGPFADLTIKGVTQRFRYVPSGTFMMGSPEDEPGRDKDETRVRVTLTHSFWMADSECTQGFWQQVAGRDNSRFTGLERPVERVSWEDCKAFCITLSKEVPGLRARLPTEAEWEYACRAGVDGPYPGSQGEVASDKLDVLAWFDKDSTVSWFGKDLRSTHVVKGKGSNRIGLCDMLGNVWEWCEDRYGSYAPTAVTDPIGNERETRVARGGSFGDSATKVRAASRLAVRQDMRTLYLGMRLVLAVDWPPGQEPRAASAAASEIPVVAPRAPISTSSVPATTAASVAPAPKPVAPAPAPAPAIAPAPAPAPAAKAVAPAPAPASASAPATPPAPAKASTSPAAPAAPALVPAKTTP